MRNCFIPNCDIQSRNMTKRMMFLPPKDQVLFEKWKAVLPKKRLFKKHDRVCERHFDKEDIITTWDHLINGTLHKLERGKPRLKPNAIPCINIPAQNEENQNYTERKRKRSNENSNAKEGKTSNSPSPKKKNPKEKIEIIAKNEEIYEIAVITADQAEHNKQSSDDVTEQDLINQEKYQQFETIYDDIYEIILPTTQWGIHRDPERKFVAFTHFNPKLMTYSKVVYIDNELNSVIQIKGKVISKNNLEAVSIESVTDILGQLDEHEVCEGLDKNCEGIAKENQFCEICLKRKLKQN